MKERTLTVTSDTTEACTVNDTVAILGKLYAIQWVVGTSANTTDLVISTQGGYAAKTVLTVSPSTSALYYPRDLVHDAAGTALTGTSGGDRCLPLLDGTLRVVSAQQGEDKTGQVCVYYLDD